MGDVQDKIWGTTQTLIDHPHNSTHHIVVLPGGYCSWHLHERKWNAFVVLRGCLDVITETGHHFLTLERGVLPVAPGIRHRFINQTGGAVEALEYYWPEGIVALGEDIVRFDEGGIRK